MSVVRLTSICELVNASKPDLIVLLGDFNGGHVFVSRPVWPIEWVDAIAQLKAPCGVWAILGNHDWWHGPVPGMRGDEGESVRRALAAAKVGLLENSAVRLMHQGSPFGSSVLRISLRIELVEVAGAARTTFPGRSALFRTTRPSFCSLTNR